MTAERLGRGVFTVVPVTTNVSKVFPFQVFLEASTSGLSADSKAQAEQVRSVDIGRILETAGVLKADDLAALDEALRLHLAL